jgi:hypothetical protein
MTTRSPVLELQQLASSSDVDEVTLLRKALLVATKLKLDEFKQWIECELNGYGDKLDVPPYRRIEAELEALNPHRGWIPFLLQDKTKSDEFCKPSIRQSLSSLAACFDKSVSPLMTFDLSLSQAQMRRLLAEQQKEGVLWQVRRTVARNQVAAILDAVRNRILLWALKLEQEGILGEGISFTQKEVEVAASNPHIQIENFQGIFGNVQHSTVTQSLSMDVQNGDWASLESYLYSKGVSIEDTAELKTAVEAEPQLGQNRALGDRVGGWIGKMVSKAATGAWQVSVSTAGSLLSSAIMAYYGA